MKSNGNYDWSFSTIGGVTRVNITSGEDIAHLGELDRKLWTVLSCPVKGLEVDEKTMAYIDTDGDGKIHVEEILASAKWLTTVLSDPESLIRGGDTLPLSLFNKDNAEGLRLYESACQILENLGLTKDEISISDVSDTIAIFAKTRFNGDGVITPASTDDEGLKALISDIIKTLGAVKDRSGEDGVDEATLAKFYENVAAYLAWKAAGTDAVLAFGPQTDAALDACNVLRAKVEDYFMRCHLASFSTESTASLDVSQDSIAALSGKNLSDCGEQIASLPLARVSSEARLSLTEGINPAWQSALKRLKDLAFPAQDSITEAQWKELCERLAAYSAWKAAKAGAEVESLGIERLNEISKKPYKDELSSLIAQDKELSGKAAAMGDVEKLLYLHRDFYKILKNYVTLSDLYDRFSKAIFQAGTLFIDCRSCDLCIKVSDMGKQSAMAPSTGMYIAYCDCTSKAGLPPMTIAAVVTDGDIDGLKVGKNGVFYDRLGRNYDAVITKIIDNPISIRQAFWSPYRKMGEFIEAQINKFASTQNTKVLDGATANITSAGSKIAEAPAPDAKPQPFDIAKFCGLFAVIGMALGTICSFLLSLVTGFLSLSWWQMPLVILAIFIVISGPSMIMAWLKLRKRDLAPVLNANGWAVNAKVIVNTRFGATLTHLAKLPTIVGDDPFAEKKLSPLKKALLWIVVLGGLAVAVYSVFFKESSSAVQDSVPQTEVTAPADSTIGDEL